MGFFDKIKQGLAKTKNNIAAQLGGIFDGFTGANNAFFDELDEALILADAGVELASQSVETLRKRVKEKKLQGSEELKRELQNILTDVFADKAPALNLDTKPSVILVIGVNGVGKTTTIGKLASRLSDQNKKVLLCAGDTFRAAAAEQLAIWADRAKVDMVKHSEGSDPGAVIYAGIQAAKARGADIIIADTAGRLHNKQNLMNELSKISRIIDRALPEASKEPLLVIAATTGQNGLIQAWACSGAA